MEQIHWTRWGIGVAIILLIALLVIALRIATQLRWHAKNFAKAAEASSAAAQSMVEAINGQRSHQTYASEAVIEQLRKIGNHLQTQNGRILWLMGKDVAKVLADEKLRASETRPGTDPPSPDEVLGPEQPKDSKL